MAAAKKANPRPGQKTTAFGKRLINRPAKAAAGKAKGGSGKGGGG